MLDNKKNLIAVAIAGAFALPIAAQAQSTVEVYGKLYPEIVNGQLSGATAKGTVVNTLSAAATGAADSKLLSMDSPNSRLGFRGTEDLGGGMKAFYQLEMGLGVDTGANSSTSLLFSRDSFVGVSGGFGSVKLGTMDTVYKTLGDTMSFLGISSGNFISASNILSKPGFGTSSASSFHLRRGNSIIYESPKVAGFQGLFDYSLGEVTGSSSSTSVISGGVKYNAGPLYLAVAYENHKDLFGASKNVPTAIANNTATAITGGPTSTDTAVRFTAQYKVTEATRVEGNYATIQYDETGGTAGKFANYKHNVWSIAGEHKLNNAVTLVGSYGAAAAGTCTLVGTAACSTAGLDGKMLNLGVGYNFSKRTMLFALYSNMNNGASAVYNNFGSGSPATGQDISIFAAGISHNF